MLLQPWVALLPLAILLPALAVATRRRPTEQRFAALALAVYVAVLLGLTFFPVAVAGYPVDPSLRLGHVNLVPFATIGPALHRSLASVALRLVVLNILAFVPLGALLPMVDTRLRSPMVVLLVGFAASVAIEVGQYF